MSSKSKGIRAERELIYKFWSKGWAALRVAGSGSMHFPSPDLLVGNKTRVLGIECKVTKSTRKYFKKEEIKNLGVFCEYFGAEPWVAVKFHREPWFFLNPEDLNATDKSYVVSIKKAARVGLTFSQITGSF